MRGPSGEPGWPGAGARGAPGVGTESGARGERLDSDPGSERGGSRTGVGAPSGCLPATPEALALAWSLCKEEMDMESQAGCPATVPQCAPARRRCGDPDQALRSDPLAGESPRSHFASLVRKAIQWVPRLLGTALRLLLRCLESFLRAAGAAPASCWRRIPSVRDSLRCCRGPSMFTRSWRRCRCPDLWSPPHGVSWSLGGAQ